MTMKTLSPLWRDRLRAFSIHLSLSFAVAIGVALVVFFIWYPYPYRDLSGGRELFLLVVSVDVIIGPLITLVVYNRSKTLLAKSVDFGTIALLQIGALIYGLHTVTIARPVHLVFEYNAFRVIHANDVPQGMLGQTPPGITALPWEGPDTLSIRRPKDVDEKVKILFAALGGVFEGARPDLWQPYEAAREDILKTGRPLAQLRQRFPQEAARIDEAVAKSQSAESDLIFIPIVSRQKGWTALVNRQNLAITFLAIDSF